MRRKQEKKKFSTDTIIKIRKIYSACSGTFSYNPKLDIGVNIIVEIKHKENNEIYYFEVHFYQRKWLRIKYF